MTRGGPRTGAGRPPLTGEKRTVHLGGVHVTPTQLAAYKVEALRSGLTLSTWVTLHLDAVVLR